MLLGCVANQLCFRDALTAVCGVTDLIVMTALGYIDICEESAPILYLGHHRLNIMEGYRLSGVPNSKV